MSEWIDFVVYVVQLVMLGVFIPRQSVQFTVPAMVDRNPAWPASHPERMRAIASSRWFLNTFYAWTVLSIGALLSQRLGLFPSIGSVDTPSWENLKNLHGLFMTVGVIGYLACFLYWTRWLAATVPLAATRTATLKPRSPSDYLPGWWRWTIEALTAAQLAAWLILPALGFGGGRRYWATFAFAAAITVSMSVLAHYTTRRRPSYGDRLFGDAYRRLELRVYDVMRVVAPLALGAMTFGRIAGLDVARPGHLAVVLFSCILGFAFLRLRPAQPGAPTSFKPAAHERQAAA